jgi:hypothetical protein
LLGDRIRAVFSLALEVLWHKLQTVTARYYINGRLIRSRDYANGWAVHCHFTGLWWKLGLTFDGTARSNHGEASTRSPSAHGSAEGNRDSGRSDSSTTTAVRARIF